jgi:hypothetical protein
MARKYPFRAEFRACGQPCNPEAELCRAAIIWKASAGVHLRAMRGWLGEISGLAQGPMSWIVLRLVAFLVVLAIGGSFTVFLFTQDRRWLRFAWQIFKYTLILVLIVLALVALERLVLVA